MNSSRDGRHAKSSIFDSVCASLGYGVSCLPVLMFDPTPY